MLIARWLLFSSITLTASFSVAEEKKLQMCSLDKKAFFSEMDIEVIGQDSAKLAIWQSLVEIDRDTTESKEKNRVRVIEITGPPGVGKSLIPRVLHRVLKKYGCDWGCFYYVGQDLSDTTSLLGGGHGYTVSLSPSPLFRVVEEYSTGGIFVFDEAEKIHPSIFNRVYPDQELELRIRRVELHMMMAAKESSRLNQLKSYYRKLEKLGNQRTMFMSDLHDFFIEHKVVHSGGQTAYLQRGIIFVISSHIPLLPGEDGREYSPRWVGVVKRVKLSPFTRDDIAKLIDLDISKLTSEALDINTELHFTDGFAPRLAELIFSDRGSSVRATGAGPVKKQLQKLRSLIYGKREGSRGDHQSLTVDLDGQDFVIRDKP